MEYVKLYSLDQTKVHIDSVAILTRKTTAGTPIGPNMVLRPKEELQCLLYMGSSDGCVTQYTCVVAAPAAGGADGETPTAPTVTGYSGTQGGSAFSTAPAAAAAPAAAYRVTALQTQKRNINADQSSGSVPFLYVDDQLREPRVIVLSNGKITMLHYNSLDPLSTFHAVRALDGATMCCVGRGFTEGRRLAAVVKRQLVLVEYSESSCSPVVTTATQPLMLPENVQQMALHHHVLICGTKREYVLYDVRTNHVVDQVVVDKMTLGAALRYLPAWQGGQMVIRLGDVVVSYDGRSRKPIDPQTRIGFSEHGVIDVAHCNPFLIGMKADGRVTLKSTIDDDEVPDSGITLPGGYCRAYTACPLMCVVASGQHLGVLVCTPPLVAVARYILAGAYERAVRHYEHHSNHGSSGSTTTGTDAIQHAPSSSSLQPDAAGPKYLDGLRCIRHACGVHALQTGRYHDAFQFFELAETPIGNIARAIVDLRPLKSADAAATAITSTYRSPQDLYQFLTSVPIPELTVPQVQISNVSGMPQGSILLDMQSPRPDVAAAYQQLYQHLRSHRTSFADEKDATVDQRDVDYALFALIVHGKATYSEEDLNDLFLPACALNIDECIVLVQKRQQQQLQLMHGTSGDARPDALSSSLLSLLYASCGKYAQALQRCRELRLVVEAIVPLQLSGELGLYVEHLPWMLEANPVTAIRALTTHAGGRPVPSVELMLPLVMPYNGQTLSTYLEYAIRQLRSRDTHIHTIHALNYIDMIQELRSFGLEGFSSKSDNALKVSPGSESGFLGDTRRQLLRFLSASNLYDVDVVVTNLTKAGGLHDELVAAHRSCGEHDLALQILVYTLHDIRAAVRYCSDVHEGRPNYWQRGGVGATADGVSHENNNGMSTSRHQDHPHTHGDTVMDNTSFSSQSSFSSGMGSQSGAAAAAASDWPRTSSFTSVQLPKALTKVGATNVPTTSNTARGGGSDDATSNKLASSSSNETLNVLLQVLLVPPKGESPRMTEAMALLRQHAQAINPLSVLESLPGDVKFTDIATYLITTFRGTNQRLLTLAYAAGACQSQVISSGRERMLLLQRCVYIDDQRPCVVCKKRVGDAVFGVFPNLKVAHFRCFKDRELDPERGVPFNAIPGV